MPRIVNEVEYANRRNEILDVAMRLIYTKGYEQMSIQDIIDALKMSKGAFYHYFDSKPDLLEAMIQRMSEGAIHVVQPIVDDPTLPVLEKLERFFDTAIRWKTARKEILMPILRIWYADENAIVRQKLVRNGALIITPMFTQIIQQGVQEGVMNVPLPEQMGDVVVSLMIDLSNNMGNLLLTMENICSAQQREEAVQKIRDILAAYRVAIERVLGLPVNSLHLFDEQTYIDWLPPPQPVPSQL